jgi:hypothetical protein
MVWSIAVENVASEDRILSMTSCDVTEKTDTAHLSQVIRVILVVVRSW